jgi:hypothetical protein
VCICVMNNTYGQHAILEVFPIYALHVKHNYLFQTPYFIG